MTTSSSSTSGPEALTCPVCAGTDFRTEFTRVPGRWWQSQHKHRLTMRVCERCAHVLMFYGFEDEGGRYGAGIGRPERPDGAVV